MLPLPLLPPLQCLLTREEPRGRQTSSSVTGVEGCYSTPRPTVETLIPIDQTEMNNSKSYRTWIKSDDNSDAGITVYSVACSCRKVFKPTFLRSNLTHTFISWTKPKD
jgi:hypothetical protein